MIEAPTAKEIAPAFKIRGLRWWIVGLVFLATLINFIDRLTISVLAPVITQQLGLTNLQFASITTWFLVAYAASQALSGKLYDRVGTRRGFTLSILVWASAAMAHAFADRKSTRLNSSHTVISYAVFCLKKKKHRAQH